jgi:hypothetical protein
MREFAISSGGITVAGTTTMVFINPIAAPNVNLEFLRYWVGQSANATSNQQRIQLVTQVTAFPTVTGATPTKLKFADAVSVITSGTAGAAGTAGINASAEGAGAKTAVLDDAFNVLNGWLMVPTPAETRIMPAGATAGQGLYFPIAPSVLTNWAFGVHFREV